MSLEERFWEKVTISDGCWGWTGAKTQGYGVITLGARSEGSIRAHRLSYILHKGEIPAGMLVLHQCDNPECTNPDHLEVGTCADNMRHVSERKRNPRSHNTHCLRGHEFTPENTISRGGGRECRTCKNESKKKRHREIRGENFGKYPREKNASCVNGHEFTPENTYINPKGFRECRACRKAKVQQWTERQKYSNMGISKNAHSQEDF